MGMVGYTLDSSQRLASGGCKDIDTRSCKFVCNVANLNKMKKKDITVHGISFSTARTIGGQNLNTVKNIGISCTTHPPTLPFLSFARLVPLTQFLLVKN